MLHIILLTSSPVAYFEGWDGDFFDTTPDHGKAWLLTKPAAERQLKRLVEKFPTATIIQAQSPL